MKIVKWREEYINAYSIENFSVYYSYNKLKYCLLIDTGENKYCGEYYDDKSIAKIELSKFINFLLTETNGLYILRA